MECNNSPDPCPSRSLMREEGIPVRRERGRWSKKIRKVTSDVRLVEESGLRKMRSGLRKKSQGSKIGVLFSHILII